MNKVSIIIPYFKKKNYINFTLSSVLTQTYKNIEVLIIYDDPNKKDLDLIKKLKKKDKRVRLIINKNNIGPGYSRNKGLKMAKGNYVAFLDADDVWKRKKLENQILFMKKNNINFSYTSYNQIDKNGKKIKTIFAPKHQTYENLLKDCRIGLSTVVIKKKILKSNFRFSKLRTKEDLFLWIQLSKKYNLIGYNKVLSDWRKLDNSLSSNTTQKILDGFRLYYQYVGFNIFKSIYYLVLLSVNFIKKNI